MTLTLRPTLQAKARGWHQRGNLYCRPYHHEVAPTQAREGKSGRLYCPLHKSCQLSARVRHAKGIRERQERFSI